MNKILALFQILIMVVFPTIAQQFGGPEIVSPEINEDKTITFR
jgi:hypothetical protein